MITHEHQWSVLEAFAKFGFQDGDGPNFSHDVGDALQDRGLQVELDTYGLHNYMVMSVTKPGTSEDPGWALEFDGYQVPEWNDLPIEVRQALFTLDPGLSPDIWREEANDTGLDIHTGPATV